jgi:hypothetical protein
MADLPSALRALADILEGIAAQNPLDLQGRPGALSPASAPSDVWLTPQEASQRLGVPLRSLSRRWRRFSFCHALPDGMRGFRVNARELAQEMNRRR